MKIQYIYIFLLLFAFTNLNAQLYPDRHTTSPSDAWKSCQEALNPNGESGMSHWIKFDFETVQSITDVKIWNLNDPANLSDGVSSLRIDYSLDNTTWTNAGSFDVAISQGSAFYEGEIIANLNGINARYLILTAEENHGGSCFGISESRFYLGQAVPVELVSFEAECSRAGKELSWSFGDVSDFESLDVEWSANGLEWNSIYTTNEPGTQLNGIYSTKYSDVRKTRANKNFYRLNMKDLDGVSQFSEIIVLGCEITEQDITIYPQPVSDEMTVNLDLLQSNKVNYTVINLLGQKIYTNVWDAQEGMNQFKLNVDEFIPGQYILQLEINGDIIEKKFLKQ